MSPEIKHENQPSIPAGPVVTGTPVVPKPVVAATSKLEDAIHSLGSSSDLEKQIAAVLAKMKREKAEALAPHEPDWSKMTEQDAMRMDIYIPVIEHDVPDYMNMKLKDTEYEVVWASRDQRRLGQLLAEGYELLKEEHVAPDFKAPLAFGSDGQYVYVDVIAMRVHKRILYGKRRRALQVSLNQLSNRNRPPRVRVKDTFELGQEVGPGAFGQLYDPMV